MSLTEIRLGLAGAGRWGKNIIRTIIKTPNASLTRLASRNPESKNWVGQGCLIDTDWRALVVAGDLDGLIVATPPETHCTIALAAIDKGLSVFIEKPLSLDLGEARAIATAAKKRHVNILIDHIHLFHASYQLLKEQARVLGGITRIRSEGGNNGPFRSFDPLWDWGSHELSLILDLVPEEGEVAWAKTLRKEALPEGSGGLYEFEMLFPSGIRANSRFGNLMSGKSRRLEVDCPGGTLVMDDTGPYPLLKRYDGMESIFPVGRSEPLAEALRVFVDGLRGIQSPFLGVDLGVRVTKYLQALEVRLAQRPH